MTASVAPLARKSSDFIEPAELRALLKQNLGLNARKVTVSTGCSTTYLTITIRDASVDVEKVEEFAKTLHTWRMSDDDVASGQSVHVELTTKVKAALAAPFIEEIKRVAPTVRMHSGETLSTGAILWLTGQGYHIERNETGKRASYCWEHDVKAGSEWAIAKLAFDASQV